MASSIDRAIADDDRTWFTRRERESEQEKGVSMFRGNSSGKCVNTGKDAEDLGEEM